jgi:spermidine/putrescine transport system substrate-binding protein
MNRKDLGHLTRRHFLGSMAGAAALAGSGSLLAAGPAAAADAGGDLNVLGWSVYWSQEMIDLFKEKTGISLHIIGATTDQEMFTKLQSGGGDFDVVYANAGWSPLYDSAGLIEQISLDEVAGARDNLFPMFYSDPRLPYVADPNKALRLFPNMWSPFAMLWRRDLFGADEEISWTRLWDKRVPNGSAVFQGVAGDDLLALAGLTNGVAKDKLYAMEGEDLDKAIEAMRKLKPFQISDGLPDVQERFRTNKASIGMVGELGLDEQINTALGSQIVETALPKEGSLGWVDGPMLLKGARNRANAVKLFEFISSEVRYIELMFEANVSALCSRKGVESLIAKGGDSAALLKEIRADQPEVVSELVMISPPADPVAYASAWDKVLAS